MRGNVRLGVCARARVCVYVCVSLHVFQMYVINLVSLTDDNAASVFGSDINSIKMLSLVT